VEVVELECDEALLTGESIPVEKTIAALVPKDVESSAKTGQTNNEDDGNTDKPEAPDVPLGDRTNVAFMSSTVSKVCSLVYRPCTRLCSALSCSCSPHLYFDRDAARASWCARASVQSWARSLTRSPLSPRTRPSSRFV
jgi:hypothetical protein